MNWEQVSGLIIATGGVVLGALGYRRSRHVDKVSEQTGIATETRAGQAETREGQNDLIANLQADNALLRVGVGELRVEIKDLRTAVVDLTKEINRLYRKYGENGTTPPAGSEKPSH